MKGILILLVLIIVLSAQESAFVGNHHIIDTVDSYKIVFRIDSAVVSAVSDGKVIFASSRSESDAVRSLDSILSPYQITSVIQKREGRSSSIQNLYKGIVTFVPACPKEKLPDLARELESNPLVEYCDIVPNIPYSLPVETPDFSQGQWYRMGIGARDTSGIFDSYAHELEIKGQGIRIADVEKQINQYHEDFGENVSVKVSPGNSFEGRDHGTATCGVIMAQENGIGMTGIAHQSEYGFFSLSNVGPYEAIASAQEWLRPGDVVIFEIQVPDGDGNYVSAEYDNTIATLTSGLIDAGVHVIVPSGNGRVNYDLSSQLSRDRHSIVVGAGSAEGRDRLSFSGYGNRVNLQGAGEGVYTTGFGDLFNGENEYNRYYTSGYSGTSSAAPVVAGAVALVQCYAKEKYDAILSPFDMRKLLIETGTPQGEGEHIGPLPNVEQAIKELDRTIGGVAVDNQPVHTSGTALVVHGRQVHLHNYTAPEIAIHLYTLAGREVYFQVSRQMSFTIPETYSGLFVVTVSGGTVTFSQKVVLP